MRKNKTKFPKTRKDFDTALMHAYIRGFLIASKYNDLFDEKFRDAFDKIRSIILLAKADVGEISEIECGTFLGMLLADDVDTALRYLGAVLE